MKCAKENKAIKERNIFNIHIWMKLVCMFAQVIIDDVGDVDDDGDGQNNNHCMRS